MENRLWRLLVTAAVVVLVAVDQITKMIADALLGGGKVVTLIPGVFELKHTTNDGIAFGLMSGYRAVFITVTVILMIVLAAVLLSAKLRQYKMATLAGILILAGGVGNLIDRALNGEVVDFFHFILIQFPIFNVADCFVVIGSAVLVIFILFFYKDDHIVKTVKPAESAGEDESGSEYPDTDTPAGIDGGETGQVHIIGDE